MAERTTNAAGGHQQKDCVIRFRLGDLCIQHVHGHSAQDAGGNQRVGHLERRQCPEQAVGDLGAITSADKVDTVAVGKTGSVGAGSFDEAYRFATGGAGQGQRFAMVGVDVNVVEIPTNGGLADAQIIC